MTTPAVNSYALQPPNGRIDPDYRGVLSVPKENVFEIAKVANELGWQMTSHTTGGGATDLLLDAYEAADRIKPIAGKRFTVTHGSFPNAAAIARAKKLVVAFDVQPAWLYLDGPVIKDVFGPERMKYFQPWRSLSGCRVETRLDARRFMRDENSQHSMLLPCKPNRPATE